MTESRLGQPFAAVFRTERRRRARADGLGVRLARAVFLLAVVVALVPLVREVFLVWLDEPAVWELGVPGVALRAGLLVMTVVGLDVHGSVLRGPHRSVLTLLPVSPRQVVWAELFGVARRGAGWVALGAVLLSPVAVELGPWAWVGMVAVLVGAAVLALVWSTWLLLGAVHAAESEAWAPVLDAVRGNNPRAQAAIIWALAPLIFGGGLVVNLAAEDAALLWQGRPTGLLALPFLLALPAVPLIPGLADRVWFRASLVLEEIRARYASIEDPEEARRVYMDFTVRWLPADVGAWALLDLRHGWRAWRGALSMLWLVAAIAVATGWSDDPATARRTGLVVALAGWWAGGVVLRMAASDPTFLRRWLPVRAASRGMARAWAVWMWCQAPVWLGALSVLLRRGMADAGLTLGLGLASAVVAGLVSAGFAARGMGVAVYVATAALILGGVGAAIGGMG